MTLALCMDVHVPGSLTRAFRERSIDVLTSQEDGFREVADEELLVRAAFFERRLLTQDADFLAIVPLWQRSGRENPGVFFARHGLPISRMADDLELCLTCCTAEELRNRVIYMPLP